jgi:hypothetical protein
LGGCRPIFAVHAVLDVLRVRRHRRRQALL